MAYNFKQQYPLQEIPQDKVLSDITLPTQAQVKFWNNTDYLFDKEQIFNPNNKHTQSGQNQSLLFRCCN